MVPISASAAYAARLSFSQSVAMPPRPRSAKSPVARRLQPPQSRAHCQPKYWRKLLIWAPRGDCRSRIAGLPYWTRLSTSISAWEKNPTGSPSLIGGYCAARIGR